MKTPEAEYPFRCPGEKCSFFDSDLVRMAMAWAREKGFEEAALVNVRPHSEVQ
jgi:hypothetical protein